ncbi:MAG: helix-turn-helix domain-containing protein [Clostridiales Family XIII bacterium]|nr:helix-turn-helix domain-containing protein [Clostridiales Family XIII bacterium]
MAKGKFEKWLLPENLIRIEGWAKDGLIDEQIAANLGVRRCTLYDWKKRFPEIAEALSKGKDSADREVENALFKSALGYEYDEETYELDRKTGEMVLVKTVTKRVPPNPTSCIFWTKNRKPDEWRDKQLVDIASDVELFVRIDDGDGDGVG